MSPRPAGGRRLRRPARSLAVALALLVVGCAPGDDPGSGASHVEVADGVLALVGRDDLTWDVATATAPAGPLGIELTCGRAANHNVVLDELDVEVAACTPGSQAAGEAVLDAGTYTFVCTVPGHERTMRGTLTVR